MGHFATCGESRRLRRADDRERLRGSPMQMPGSREPPCPVRLLIGFAAGALATLTFHQIAIAGLGAAGLIRGTAWSLRTVPPLGIPQVVSLSFWAGVWGAVLGLAAPRWPRTG